VGVRKILICSILDLMDAKMAIPGRYCRYLTVSSQDREERIGNVLKSQVDGGLIILFITSMVLMSS